MVLDQREMALPVGRARADAGNLASQPLAVRDGDETNRTSVEQEDRSPNLVELESPGLDERQVVVPPSVRAGRQPELVGLVEGTPSEWA